MRQTQLRPSLPRPRAAQGFSLSEVLIAVTVGSVLMAGAASMLISHIRSTARSEALIRLQDAWSRVQFLLDQEIQESIGTPTTVSCTSLSLDIPDSSGGSDTVTYALSGTTLSRNGPQVSADDGTIIEGSEPSDQVVMTGVTSFCPTTESGEVNYTLALSDPTGVVYQNRSQPSGAHTRSRIIN